MGRHSGKNSHGFHMRGPDRDGDYQISWTVDYYSANSRLRFPRSFQKWTDEAGARRFAKKHNLTNAGRRGQWVTI